MIDLILQVGLSNVCISLALAIVAIVVEKTLKRPALTYLLWLLVFVKLLTPPVVSIPIIPFSESPDSAAVVVKDHSQRELALSDDERQNENTYLSTETRSVIWPQVKAGLKLIWLLGSGVVFSWSLIRVYRFNRLLRTESQLATRELQTMATDIANRLRLKTVPAVFTTSACLAPMVWWIGGKVRIVIPAAVLDQIGTQQSHWILAHELAHVRRRDYLVRWIEWLACVCFWWNPVMWWARQHLRANEEICCDNLVLSSLNPKPRFYADSLLNAIEFLASPVVRPPAIASEINSGGFLERRFKMIVSEALNRKTSRWLQACVLLLAVIVVPLSITYAKDDNDRTAAYLDQAWDKLQAEVEAGNMSADDAQAKMTAIEEECAARARANAHFEQVWETLQTQVEAGTLTAEDAETMVGAVKKKYIAQMKRAKYEAVEAEIRAAIEAGEIAKEEGEEKLIVLRKRMFRKDRNDASDAIWRRVGGALSEAGIERDNIRGVMDAMKRIMGEMKAEGEEFEMDMRLRDYLVNEMGLTKEQIDLVQGLARRILHAMEEDKSAEGLVGHYERMGVSLETLGRLKKALAKAGVKDRQMEGTLGGMIRVVHEMKSEGEKYEMDPRLRKYFRDELGLTGKQIELVEGLSRRLLHGLRESDHQR